jgi:hypothetical protein
MYSKKCRINLYIENNGITSVVDNRTPFVNGFNIDTVLNSGAFYQRFDQREHYGTGSMFTYVSNVIQQISDDYFYYPIVISLFSIIDVIKYIEIESKILDAIKTNKCKILLVCPYEGWSYNSFWKIIIEKLKSKFDLVNQNFVILDGNYLGNTEIKKVTYNAWEDVYAFENFSKGLKQVEEIRKNKFICLNRRPSIHRLAIATELIHYKNQGIITLSNDGGFGKENYKEVENDFFNKFPSLKEIYQEKVISSLPIVYKEDNFDVNITNPNNDDKIDKFHQSYLHIVTETFFENDTLFLSEKTFKPIWHCQPFVVFGNPNSLQQLKNIGYETFSDYIDESYDAEYDYTLRLDKIMNVVKEFISKTPKELTDIMIQMTPIFKHNMNNFEQRYTRYIKNNLLTQLRTALYE